MNLKLLLTAMLGLALAACNPMEELGDADTEVAQFHKHFDGENYDAIWSESDQILRDSGTRAEFDQMMAGLRQYWGAVQSTEREGFNINTNNGVTTVKVTHNTVFDTGNAVETFNFVRRDEGLQLAGYNITTPAQAAADKEQAENAEAEAEAEQ